MKCFRFVRAERANHRISLLCRVLGVSRSGYHAFERRPEPPRRVDDRRLMREIRRILARRRRAYGSPRMHAQLRRDGICVSRKRVERLMRRPASAVLGARAGGGERRSAYGACALRRTWSAAASSPSGETNSGSRISAASQPMRARSTWRR